MVDEGWVVILVVILFEVYYMYLLVISKTFGAFSHKSATLVCVIEKGSLSFFLFL